jgi:hypothetical protein
MEGDSPREVGGARCRRKCPGRRVPSALKNIVSPPHLEASNLSLLTYISTCSAPPTQQRGQQGRSLPKNRWDSRRSSARHRQRGETTVVIVRRVLVPARVVAAPVHVDIGPPRPPRVQSLRAVDLQSAAALTWHWHSARTALFAGAAAAEGQPGRRRGISPLASTTSSPSAPSLPICPLAQPSRRRHAQPGCL